MMWSALKMSGTYMVIKALSMHIPTSLSTAATLLLLPGIGLHFPCAVWYSPRHRSPAPASRDWSTVSRLVKSLAVRAEKGVLICPSTRLPRTAPRLPAGLSVCVPLRKSTPTNRRRREGRKERKKRSNRTKEREGVSTAVWSVGRSY